MSSHVIPPLRVRYSFFSVVSDQDAPSLATTMTFGFDFETFRARIAHEANGSTTSSVNTGVGVNWSLPTFFSPPTKA